MRGGGGVKGPTEYTSAIQRAPNELSKKMTSHTEVTKYLLYSQKYLKSSNFLTKHLRISPGTVNVAVSFFLN